MNMTKHVLVDRLDRMMFISSHMGFGTIIAESVRNNVRECITDTGVLMIKAIDNDTLITVILPDLQRARMVFRSLGYERVPVAIANKIKKNMKYAHMLAQAWGNPRFFIARRSAGVRPTDRRYLGIAQGQKIFYQI